MYTIEDWKNGKCAVINDGTVAELNEFLKLAGVECVVVGNYVFYWAKKDYYDCGDSTELPTQSVKDFLKPQLKRGDMVWVSDVSVEDAIKNKSERIFLVEIEGAKLPFRCVAEYDNDDFKNGNTFDVAPWNYAVPVQEENEVTMTVKEIEEKLGIKNLHIVR